MTENMTYAAFQSRYREQHFIGSGGFARVFKVFDHAKNHYVALKMAHVNPDWKQFTLQREVELVNKLDHHRNIARYDSCYRFNTGMAGDMDFAILKFYEYGNLEQFLRKEDLTLPEKHRVIKGILRGIGFLHRNDITHRDMKAQNILMSREDGVWTPKITDFGLAREFGGNHTMTNSSIGLTYAYAAPEQIQNQRIIKNVDLWAVGVIIYRIMVGSLPFGGGSGENKSTQSQLELSRKILELELPPELAGVAEPYQSIIRRCLISDPRQRVQTAEELIELLEPAANLEEVTVPMITPVNPPEEREPVPAVPQGETQMIAPEPPLVRDPVPPSPSRPSVAPDPVMPVYADFAVPDHNPTQFNVKPPPPAPPREPEPLRMPEVGGARRAVWPWVLAVLLLIGLVGGGFYTGAFAGAEEVITQEVTPVKPEPTTVAKDFKRITNPFAQLDAEVERVRANNDKLKALLPKLDKAVASAPKDYRPGYIAAKNCFHRQAFEEGFAYLEAAVSKATSAGNKNLLASKIKDDMASGNRRLRKAMEMPVGRALLQKLNP